MYWVVIIQSGAVVYDETIEAASLTDARRLVGELGGLVGITRVRIMQYTLCVAAYDLFYTV